MKCEIGSGCRVVQKIAIQAVMKSFAAFIVVLAVLLSACRHRLAPPEKNEPVSERSEVGIPKVSGEQLGSVLRVRVAFGGLPPRDMAGALLHRDEIPDKARHLGSVGVHRRAYFRVDRNSIPISADG